MTERIKAADYLAQIAQTPETKGNKYNAQRVEYDGFTFDSKAEADRWRQLKLLQSAGEICGLKRQVSIPLFGRDGPIMTDSGKNQRTYKADFVYVDNALGVTVIEDKKGVETPEFKLKKAILAAQGMEILLT